MKLKVTLGQQSNQFLWTPCITLWW